MYGDVKWHPVVLMATSTTRTTAAISLSVLTTFDLDEYVYAALRAGASGFVLKDTPPRELLAAGLPFAWVVLAGRCR